MSSDRLISDLDPELQPLAEKFLELCPRAKIIQTWRDPATQDDLYAKGRTTPGPIVTYLTSVKSKHCCTLDGKPAARAFDFGVFAEDGSYMADDPLYASYGAVGVSLGLVYGGNWLHFKDRDHLELPS